MWLVWREADRGCGSAPVGKSEHAAWPPLARAQRAVEDQLYQAPMSSFGTTQARSSVWNSAAGPGVLRA